MACISANITPASEHITAQIYTLRGDEALVLLYSSDPFRLYSSDGFALTTGHIGCGIDVSITPVCSV